MNASRLHADNPAADSTAVSGPALGNLGGALVSRVWKSRRGAEQVAARAAPWCQPPAFYKPGCDATSACM